MKNQPAGESRNAGLKQTGVGNNCLTFKFKTMKKSILNRIVLLVVLIAIASCKKSYTTPKLTKSHAITLSYQLAEIHNRAMEHIYLHYMQDNTAYRSNSDQFYETVHEQTINFIKSTELYNSLSQNTKNILNSILDTLSIPDANSLTTIDYSNMPDQTIIQHYMNNLHNVFYGSNNTTINEYKDDIHILREDAINSIADNQTLLEVLSTINISDFSLNYRHDHLDEWVVMFNNNASARRYIDWPWNELALSDGIGAIGQIAGMWANGTLYALASLGPEGWAAIGLVAAARAIEASAVSFYIWYLMTY